MYVSKYEQNRCAPRLKGDDNALAINQSSIQLIIPLKKSDQKCSKKSLKIELLSVGAIM